MELVAPFDPPGETANFIDAAIARYEEGAEATPSEQDAEHRRSQRSAVAAQIRFLAGDYAKASEIAAGTPSEETKELDAWAHLMEGDDLYEKAKAKNGAEADRLFTVAAQDNPDALVLAILCDFGDRKHQEVVTYVVHRLRELLEVPTSGNSANI